MNSHALDRQPQSVESGELEQLESQLQREFIDRIWNLHLSLRAGRFVIQGQAHSYHAKQLAQESLMATTKLDVVTNEIEVF